MILYYLFIGSFAVGLVLGVFQMLFGVERRSGPRPVADSGSIPHSLAHAHQEISARISLPSAAAFLAFFGLTGYLLTRFTGLGPLTRIALAAIAGGVGIAGVLALIKAWAVPSARREVVDERFVLMGHLATVTTAIGGDLPGDIEYEVDGTRYSARAWSVDRKPVGVGSEVVIERVEDGYAYVETWAHVEKRL